MNILIGIPTRHDIDIEAAISIMNLDWDGHSIDYTHADGAGVYGVAQARNRLVEKAIAGGYDKLLMIDSDMIVPEDTIIYLLDPDVPIVTGVAHRTLQDPMPGSGMRSRRAGSPSVMAVWPAG